MPTQLEQAVAHIKAGEIEKGKQLLADVIRQNPRDETAWLWMTKCVTDAEQKRYCFDKVLQINPQNQHAVEGLKRLNNPVSPITQPKSTVVQSQPVKKKGLSTAGAIAIVGLLSFVLLCAIVFFVSRIPTNANNSNQQNAPVPTQRVRPDYEQMLEANGFTYVMSDNEGNPSYSSACDATAVVKPDVVGFAANHSSDNDCAVEDIGRVIGIMYPSEVLDCVVTTIHLLDEFDQLIERTAVGYEVSVAITDDDRTLLIIMKDPR